MRESTRRFIIIWLVIFLTVFTAQYAFSDLHSFHNWNKVSSHAVLDKYGQTMEQCRWECNPIVEPTHYTVTQGRWRCPNP